MELNGDYTTHRFGWSSTSVAFQSLHGHRDDDSGEFAAWVYEPRDPVDQIGHQPMPVRINLWLFNGHAPGNHQQVELIGARSNSPGMSGPAGRPT